MKRLMKKLSKQTFPSSRMRRLRNTENIRKMIRETSLSPENLIQPIFVVDGKNKIEKISSLPGIYRYSLDNLSKEIRKLKSLGILAVALFPKIQKNRKSLTADEAFNNNGLIQTCIDKIKNKFPEVLIISDIALDPYTTHGQDGITDDSGYINNDITNEILVKQALSHANAGSDIIAPSDMMDGRVKLIRNALERQNFVNTKILSYSAKYASNYYGPFRDAVGSTSALGKSDKKTYQMDFFNKNDALREVDMDLREGADFVMVKPALPYLDIISDIRKNFSVPVFAYHVSGEYLMIKTAAKSKAFDERKILLETLVAIRRAGASSIITYYAKEASQWLK